MARAAIVYSPLYRCDIGLHVFPTDKYELVLGALIGAGAVDPTEVLEPSPSSRADLGLVHTSEYLDDLEHLRMTARTASSEVPLTAGIVQAHRIAADGTTWAALEALRRGFGVHVGGGFHHAFADRAEGFCYVNDLAVAIRVLQRDGKIARAAVVDCDLHQGNGTARIFADDPEVFTFSIHQQDLYPEKERSDLDIGLENGVGDDDYNAHLAAGLERVWAHGPDLVLYQAGADPFEGDQLGALKITFAGLERRDRLVLDGCGDRRIPVAVTLGGGYARRIEDLVRIHVGTCLVAIEAARRLDP
jgi:acetoin utilization deacetylase AcuC-like enzyme